MTFIGKTIIFFCIRGLLICTHTVVVINGLASSSWQVILFSVQGLLFFLQKTNQQSLCFMREQRGENMCLFGVLMHFISITSLRAAQLPNTKLAHGKKAVLFVGNHTNMVKTFWSITATNQPPPPVPISFDK